MATEKTGKAKDRSTLSFINASFKKKDSRDETPVRIFERGSCSKKGDQERFSGHDNDTSDVQSYVQAALTCPERTARPRADRGVFWFGLALRVLDRSKLHVRGTRELTSPSADMPAPWMSIAAKQHLSAISRESMGVHLLHNNHQRGSESRTDANVYCMCHGTIGMSR